MRLVAFVDAPVSLGGGGLFVETSKQYGDFLCFERSDAFLVGLLRFAMSNGLDIKCEAPVGEELLYNLRMYLIPSLAKHCPDLYETKISACPDSSELSNSGAVGTGASLGIDSMHSILHHLNSGYDNHNLTHLVLNNVGAYNPGKPGALQWKQKKAREFSSEVALPLIEIDSNIAEMFDRWNCYYFDLTNTYMNAFAVLALQKFWKTYYYASVGHDFSYFSLFHVNDHDCAWYDLLTLDVFSSRSLRFHSEGGAKSRFEKTCDVVEYGLAQKYLHVCTDDSGPNCNKCNKCRRTLVTLDALNALQQFRDVFDIDYYISHRSDYMRWLVKDELRHGRNTMTGEAYKILKSRRSGEGILMRDNAFAHVVVLAEKVLPTHVLIPLIKRAVSFHRRVK